MDQTSWDKTGKCVPWYEMTGDILENFQTKVPSLQRVSTWWNSSNVGGQNISVNGMLKNVQISRGICVWSQIYWDNYIYTTSRVISDLLGQLHIYYITCDLRFTGTTTYTTSRVISDLLGQLHILHHVWSQIYWDNYIYYITCDLRFTGTTTYTTSRVISDLLGQLHILHHVWSQIYWDNYTYYITH